MESLAVTFLCSLKCLLAVVGILATLGFEYHRIVRFGA